MAKESFSVKLHNTIMDEVQKEVERVTEEEIKLAKKRIEMRVHEVADALALRVIENYTLVDGTNSIRIEVNKKKDVE